MIYSNVQLRVRNCYSEIHPEAESLLEHDEEGKGDDKKDGGADGVGSVAKEGDQDPSQDVVVHS